jgi:hypothetical protein
VAHRPLDGAALRVGQRDLVLGHLGEVALLEEDDVAGVRQDRRHIGGDVVLALPETDHQGRGILRGDDGARRSLGDNRQRIGPAHPSDRCANGIGQRLFSALLADLFFIRDQVREDLGVRLGSENVPVRRELRLQLEVILDDAVVHDRDARVLVRMRVLVRRPPVRCPARVSNAGAAVRLLRAQLLLEIFQLPLRSHHHQAIIGEQRDARRIVAPVLEFLQPLNEEVGALFTARVSNDAAHVVSSSQCFDNS